MKLDKNVEEVNEKLWWERSRSMDEVLACAFRFSSRMHICSREQN